MLLFMLVSNYYALNRLWDICCIVYAHDNISYSGPGPLVECDDDMLDWYRFSARNTAMTDAWKTRLDDL